MEEIVALVRPEIYAMKPYSSARTEGDQDVEIYLDANENPFPPFPGGAEQEGLNRYPEPQPRALLHRFSQIYGMPPEQTFLSRGADEAVDLLVRAFCAAGRDAVLVTPPTFVMYETAARIQNAGVVEVPLAPATFGLDVEGMSAACDANPGVKLVFVCSPNNPTANLMDREAVRELCRRMRGRALVVVDELYVDYSGHPSMAGEITDHPNLVVLRSLSKEYSLAGERCGITLAHAEVIEVLRRIMPPYPLPVTAIRAVQAAMSPEGIAYSQDNIRRIVAERERVRKVLEASPAVIDVLPSDANFLLLRTSLPQLLCAVLAERGIKVRDRSHVVDGGVRVSIGTGHENDAMLRAFHAFEQVAGSR